MTPDFLRHWIIIIVAAVAVIMLFKTVFFPTPVDILVLFALILALFALIDFDIFTGGGGGGGSKCKK